MTNLRPMTMLENVTLTVKVTGEAMDEYQRKNAVNEIRRVVLDYGRLPKWEEGRKGIAGIDQYYWEEAILEGVSVSALTRLHKRLAAVQKEAARWYYYGAAYGPEVQVEFQIGGDAEGYDFAKLAKEPTPKEDWDVLRKLRNKSDLTNKKWQRAFWLLGLEATPIKEGRKITGFTVEGVEHNQARNERGRMEEWVWVLDKDVRAVWIGKASDLLGLPDPALTVGLPARARDYRTDLEIRTCPCCFRDIKASGYTDGAIADHGFTINGRGWSGWGGYRTGSCKGVGRLPWEQSPEATKEMIPAMLAHSAALARELTEGPPAKLAHPSQSRHPGEKIDAAHPEWASAVRSWRYTLTRELADLWTGNYGSIPWYRCTIRTWKPVADDVPAVGAPLCKPETDDFNGKPATLSED